MTRDRHRPERRSVTLARRAVLATRNIRHFDDLETSPVNPWDAGAGTR